MNRYINIALVAVVLLVGVRPVSADPIITINPVDKSTEYLTIPYFAWKDVPSDLPYPGYYMIEIATGKSFKDVIDNATLPAMINHYSPDFELDYGKTYYWRIAYTENKEDSPEWNKVQSFTLTRPENVIKILPDDGWKEISGKFQQAVDLSRKKQAVALLFPKDTTFHVKQPPIAGSTNKKTSKKEGAGLASSKGKYLFVAEGATNIVINGNGSKLILEKDPEERDLGLFKLTLSSHIQLKHLTVDFAQNSVGHFGGVISQLNKQAGTFTVTVDPKIYANFAEIKAQEVSIRKKKGKVKESTHGVFFLKQSNSRRVWPSGEKRPMKQTWTEAQDKENPNQFHFSKSEENDSFDDFARNLEDGDIALTGYRGGDLISMTYSTHMVFNDLTSYAARNRMFIPGMGSKYVRLINCRFVRGKGRYMGAAAGGIGVDASHYPWIEGNRFEGCHDDTYHSQPKLLNGSDSVLVYKTNELVAGYRHSIWLNGDRNWVVGNTIQNGGLYGIKLGRSSPKNSVHNNNIGHQVSGAIIEGNLIEHVAFNHGLTTQTGLRDPVSGKYNEYLYIRNNTVVDVSGGDGYYFSWLKNSIVEHNLFRSTPKRILNPGVKETPKAFYFTNAINVKGKGNRAEEPEFKESDRLLIEGSENVNVEVLE